VSARAFRPAGTARLLSVAALLLAAVATGAPQDAGGQGYTEQGTYAGTPEAFVPYRHSGPVYWHFYEAPPPFRGTGRLTAPPTGLRSIKIGLIAPLEDTADTDIGRSMYQGVTLAIEEANRADGFRGVLPYALAVRNDSGIWGASSNTFVELAWRDDVWAVIGSVDGNTTHTVLRVALKAELPIVNTACTDPTVTETAIPWILRCYPDDRQYGYRLARAVFMERGHERVAVLRANDKYGRMGVKEFTDAARRIGHPLALEVRYLPGEQVFERQLERIRRAKVDAVVLWSNAQDGARILAAMHAAGMEHEVFGTERLVSAAFLAQAGAASEGVVAVCPMNVEETNAAWDDFRARYSQSFGDEPDAFAAYSYDGTRILLDAFERAGLNRVRIRDELAALETYEGLAGPMTFDPTHNNLGQIHVFEVQGGRFVHVAGP